MTPIGPATAHWIASLPNLAAGAFVASLWQGLLLAAGVWLYLRLVPKTTAAIRFTIWTAAFAILALLPFLHAYQSPAVQASPAQNAILHLDARWAFAIAGLWALLSLLRAASLASSGLRLHRIWKRATPLETFPSLLDDPALRKAQLCASSDSDVPCPSMIGFFSPRILIPQDLLATLTQPELEQIVQHEMGHLRRHDDWLNLLQKIALVLFPLNPVLVWIERRLCFEREIACDDAVLERTRAPKAYAKCLTHLAEQRLGRRALGLSLGAWERQSELARRVHRILERGEPMGRTQARVLLGVLVLALVGSATELSRCPRLISFTNPEPTLQATAALPAPALPAPASFVATRLAAIVQPVVSNDSAPAHEILLKASMPSQPARPAATPAAHRRPRRASTPPLKQARNNEAPTQQAQQMQEWVVLTSSRPASGVSHISRMVLTAPSDPSSLPAFAAVPTDIGWLIIQL